MKTMQPDNTTQSPIFRRPGLCWSAAVALVVTCSPALQLQAGSVLSGSGNTASGGGGAVVTGGRDNKASGLDSYIGAGRRNTASGRGAAVIGGTSNTASELGALIGTGVNNLNEGRDSGVLAGGNHSIASGAIRSGIVAGKSNVLRPGGDYSMIGAGRSHSVKAPDAAIAAGANNEIAFTGDDSFIGAGEDNLVSGTQSAVLAGESNLVSGKDSVVLGGDSNAATGDFTTMLGGILAESAADHSLVFGREVSLTLDADGSVYLADGVDRVAPDVQAFPNHFYARFGGGYTFFTNSSDDNDTTGVRLSPNGTSWITLSSKTTKEAFVPVDTVEVLEKVAGLELSRWHYKADTRQTPHMGVMAEDFHTAFGLGHDARGIDTLNADGVQMAAIQGLHTLGKQSETRISELQHRNATSLSLLEELEQDNTLLQQRLEALEQRLEKAASGGGR